MGEEKGEKANFAFHTGFESLLSTTLGHEQILLLPSWVPEQVEKVHPRTVQGK